MIETGIRSIGLHQLTLMIEGEEEIKGIEGRKTIEGIAHLIGIVEGINSAGLEIILVSKYLTLAHISCVLLVVR